MRSDFDRHEANSGHILKIVSAVSGESLPIACPLQYEIRDTG